MTIVSRNTWVRNSTVCAPNGVVHAQTVSQRSKPLSDQADAVLLTNLTALIDTLKGARQAADILCYVREVPRVEHLLALISAELAGGEVPMCRLPFSALLTARVALADCTINRRLLARLVSDLIWEIEQPQAS